MIRAENAIKTVTGRNPEFVRPVGFHANTEVRQVYAKVGLSCIQADVDSGDSLHPLLSPEAVCTHLRREITLYLKTAQAPPASVVILMHDPNQQTALYLPMYLGQIDEAIRQCGYAPRYASSSSEIRAALRRHPSSWRLSIDES